MATAIALAPALAISSATDPAAALFKSAMATLPPSRAKASAISLPMPLAAPVTTATLSARRVFAVGSLDKASSLCKFMGFSFPVEGLGLRQVVMGDLAERERQIRNEVHR